MHMDKILANYNYYRLLFVACHSSLVASQRWIDELLNRWIASTTKQLNIDSPIRQKKVDSPNHRLTDSPISRFVNKINVFSKFLLFLQLYLNSY
jgi:hypothetical protein